MVEYEEATAAYVFVRKGEAWTLREELTAGGNYLEEYSDVSVAIDGDTIAIGVPGTAEGGSGQTFVYVRGAQWSRQAQLKPQDFSRSMSAR